MKDGELFEIIQRYIDPGRPLYRIYMIHAVLVTQKALSIAKRLKLGSANCLFIEQASMLHDIGIVMVDAQEIDCHGKLTYIEHGIAGRKILEDEGLHGHALICERHVGIGLTSREIQKKKLTLPARDMVPQTIAEEIICFADLFFSKGPKNLWREKKMAEVLESAAKYDQVEQFLIYAQRFLKKSELKFLNHYTCGG